MSATSQIELVESIRERFAAANAEYASRDHQDPWHFWPGKGPRPSGRQLPNQPAVQILTCMDPRCNPDHFLGLKNEGDRVPAILRNAGGRVTEDALRSMRVLSGIAGSGENTLGLVAVIHHTDCGMMAFEREFVEKRARSNTVSALQGKIEDLSWGFFQDLERSVREDVALIKNDPFLPKDLVVLGYVYNVDSGELKEVQA